MVVMILEKVPVSLRGKLTRWLIEPQTGLFIRHVSALVSDQLWENCVNAKGTGSVVQIWSTNNEQHFAMRMSGDTKREIEENEGMQLIRIRG